MASDERGPGTPVTRRVVLQGGATAMLTAFLPFSLRSVQAAPTQMPRWLGDDQFETLRAVVDRMIPADHEPGALAADCARFIDAFLGAFETEPPFIYAGAPYSDRGGNPSNDFTEFLPLDAYEELGWRLFVEGSANVPDAPPAIGNVKGLQRIYAEGLAHLDARAADYGFASFAAMPAPTQELLLNDRSDGDVQDLVDAAYLDTMAAMYGPPEYGGNQNLLGWTYTGFEGDVQPRGYTDEQVVNADNPGAFDALLPPSHHERAGNAQSRSASRTPITHAEAEAIAAAAPRSALVAPPSTEMMSAIVADSQGSLARLRAALKPYADQLQGGR